MQVKVQKWGNSDGIRIPSNMLRALNIKSNDFLDIVQIDDKIIISVPKKTKVSLAERVEKYKGTNLTKDFEWDESVGNEIW